MQSAGRAVATPPPTLPSLYNTSSRHVLPRPARHHHDGAYRQTASQHDNTWNPGNPIIFASQNVHRDFTWQTNAPIVFSGPSAQKRCASSSSKPAPPPTRKPPMVFYGRKKEAAIPTGNSAVDDLDSLFEKKARPVTAVRRVSPATPTPAPTVPKSTPVKPHPAPAVSRSTPTSTPSHGRADKNPAPTVSTAHTKQQPVHVADHLSVPEGTTTVNRHEAADKEQRGAPEKPATEDTTTPASQPLTAFDEILRLRKELEILNETALADQKKISHYKEELDMTQARLSKGKSENESLEARLEAQREAHDKQLRREQAHNNTMVSSRDTRIDLLTAELERERDPFKRQLKRRTSAMQEEAENEERRKREQLEQGRKDHRKDYQSLRAFFTEGMNIAHTIAMQPELLRKNVTFEQRSMSYWGNALKTFHKFITTNKEGDLKRKEAQRVEANRERLNLQQRRELDQNLIMRLERRDGILRQIRKYLEESASQSEQARDNYERDVRLFINGVRALSNSSHLWRMNIRRNRYDMDPTKDSPLENYVQRRTSTRIAAIRSPVNDFAAAIQAEIVGLKDQGRVAARQGASRDRIRDIDRQLLQLYAMADTTLVLGHLATIQKKSDEIHWIKQQPLYLQLYYISLIPSQKRVEHCAAQAPRLARWLKDSGLSNDHKLFKSFNMTDLHVLGKAHSHALFTYAYFATQQNALNSEEIDEALAQIDSYNENYVRNWIDVKAKIRPMKSMAWSLRTDTSLKFSRSMEALKPSTRKERRSRRRGKDVITTGEEATIPLEGTPTPLEDIVSEALPGQASVSAPHFDPTISELWMGGEEEDPNITQAGASQADSDPRPTKGSDASAQSIQPAQSAATVQPAELVPSISETTPSFRDHWQSKGTERTPSTPHRSSVIMSRARSKRTFKPPRPTFKPSDRRSVDHRAYAADFVEELLESDEQNRNMVTEEGPTLIEDGSSPPSTAEEPSVSSDVSTTIVSGSELVDNDELPPLMYAIPSKDLRDALLASQTSQAAFWRWQLYKNSIGEKPIRHYCTNFEKAEQVAKKFLNEKVIGFDIEWEPNSVPGRQSIKDNVSLIQIACDDRIALFQIAIFYGDTIDKLMPPSLKVILESPEIIKAGVNISGDFTRLQRCLDIQGQGIFELSHLYKVVKFSENEPLKVDKKPFRLADQVQNVLFLPLAKGSVRTSAWSRRLSLEQVEYAASDAYAGYRLFRELDNARQVMNPVPPRPACWELQRPIILGNGQSHEDVRKQHKLSKGKEMVAQTEKVVSIAEADDSKDEDVAEDAESQVGLEDDEADVNNMEDDLTMEEASEKQGQSASQAKHPLAEAWRQEWYDSLPPDRKNKNIPNSIRAYALWHCEGLGLEEVAASMRQPPLALATVATYVLETVKLEKLPCEPDRLQEALEVVSPIARRRYRSLMQKVEPDVRQKTV